MCLCLRAVLMCVCVVPHNLFLFFLSPFFPPPPRAILHNCLMRVKKTPSENHEVFKIQTQCHSGISTNNHRYRSLLFHTPPPLTLLPQCTSEFELFCGRDSAEFRGRREKSFAFFPLSHPPPLFFLERAYLCLVPPPFFSRAPSVSSPSSHTHTHTAADSPMSFLRFAYRHVNESGQIYVWLAHNLGTLLTIACALVCVVVLLVLFFRTPEFQLLEIRFCFFCSSLLSPPSLFLSFLSLPPSLPLLHVCFCLFFPAGRAALRIVVTMTPPSPFRFHFELAALCRPPLLPLHV